MLQRGRPAAHHARRPPAPDQRLRRGGVARGGRRLDRSHDRGRARARRGPHREADQQQGPGHRVPGGPRRLPEARRRRGGEHRRGQPVRRARHTEAGGADPRGPRGHGRRRPGGGVGGALLAAEEAAPAARELGGPRSVGDRRSRHHVGLPRLQPGGRDPGAGGLEVHLHPGDHHPGREDARRGRAHPDSHQSEGPGIAALSVDVVVRAPQHGLALPHLRAVRAAQGVHDRGGGRRARRLRDLGPLPVVLHRRLGQGPHPVPDPGRRAVHCRRAAGGAGRGRRRAGRLAGAAAADPRAGATGGAPARGGALAL